MKLDSKRLFFLTLLRVFIGWHFLYEGLAKVINPNWTSQSFLMDSKGWFGPLFHKMAGNADVILTIDFLNKWGLVLIGLGLILGLFSRIATLSGIVLLGFYYLSHPPLVGINYAVPSEGSYLIVNKNLIEMASLIVLYLFPTSKITGLDKFINLFICKKKS